MLKKVVILLVAVMLGLSVFADIIPSDVSDIPFGTLGVYQSNNSIRVYDLANKQSKVLFEQSWVYSTVSSSNFADDLFAILQEKKELSFVYAIDLDEDFVEVIYNKKNRKSGWAYKEDDFQFLPWITFFNMYGRKYGLKLLKNIPDSILELHSRSDINSQTLGKVNRPREIRLTAIQGNWALVTVLDIEGVAKTGYIQWRGSNGELYLFPAIK